MSNLLTLHQDAGGMVLLSAGDPKARSIVIRVANEHVSPSLAAMIGGSYAEERALQVIITACGFIFADPPAAGRARPFGCSCRDAANSIEGGDRTA